MPSNKQRYPGIQPFTEADAAIFYGRTQEIKDLFNLIMVEKLVVLFSKSGMGKTSLLNAGIKPLLTTTAFLPVSIRLNNTAIPLKQQVIQVLQPYIPTVSPSATLWEILKTFKHEQNNTLYAPLLIFDQFEEIFTLYNTEQRLSFITEFSDLVSGKMPEDIQKRLINDIKNKIITDKQVIKEFEKPPVLKIIIAIRSDLLHKLHEISDIVPTILRSRFELQALNNLQAKEAITEPAKLTDPTFKCPPFDFSTSALADIITNLSNKEGSVESFQLQLLCSNIENKIIANPLIKIVTPEFYGSSEGIQKILNEFYNDTLQSIPNTEQPQVRVLVEEGLIQNRRRVSIDQFVIIEKYTVSMNRLDDLENKRLIRKEPRLNSYYYEISHDTLIDPILVSYQKRKTEEDRIKAINERKALEQKLEEARKKRRMGLLITAVTTCFAIAAIIATIFAINQKQNAQTQYVQAKSNYLWSQAVLNRNNPTLNFRLAQESFLFDTSNTNSLSELLQNYYGYSYKLNDTLYNTLYYNKEVAAENALLVPNTNLLYYYRKKLPTAYLSNIYNDSAAITMQAHQAPITGIDVSSNGDKLISFADDSTARLWNNKGQLLKTIKHKANVAAAFFSPNAQYLSLNVANNTQYLYTSNGELIDSFTNKATRIQQLNGTFSPNSSLLSIFESDTILHLYNLENKKIETTIIEKQPIIQANFLYDNKTIILGILPKNTSADEGLFNPKLYSTNGKTIPINRADIAKLKALSFLVANPYNNTFIIISDNNLLRIFDTEGKMKTEFDTQTSVSGVTFTPEGNILVVSNNYNNTTACNTAANLSIWNTSGELLYNFPKENNLNSTTQNAFFDLNGKKLITSDYNSHIKVWNWKQAPAVQLKSSNIARKVLPIPNSNYLAVLPIRKDTSRRVELYNLNGTKPDTIPVWYNHNLKDMVLSPSNKQLLTVSSTDSNLYKYSGANFTTISKIPPPSDIRLKQDLKTIEFSPNSEFFIAVYTANYNTDFVATYSANNWVVYTPVLEQISNIALINNEKLLLITDYKGNIAAYNVGKKEVVWKNNYFNKTINKLIACPNNNYAMVASKNKDNNLFTIDTAGKIIKNLPGHEASVRSITFSPNGTQFISTSEDKSAIVWDATTFKPIKQIISPSGTVYDAAFSPNGKYIATASGEKDANLYTIDGNLIYSFDKAHTSTINKVQFTSNSNYLITCSSDNTAIVWAINPRLLINNSDNLHILPLSMEQKQEYYLDKQ